MTTIRVAKRQRFTSVARDTINNSQLSFRARGVLVWLLDKPDDWSMDSNSISNHCSEGRDAIRTTLTELEEAGYLKREKYQGNKGRWVHVCTIYEVPPEPGFQATGNQAQVLQAQESQALSNELLIPKTDTEREENPPSIEDEFEPWWKLYPRKIEKAAARKAYAARRKTGVSSEDLFRSVQHFAREMESVEQVFVKHGATFLNQSWDEWIDGPPDGWSRQESKKPRHAQPLPTHPIEEGDYPDFDAWRR